MDNPMFDNSFSPQSPRRRMILKELVELSKTDPQQVLNYGKLRCNETVEFLPSNEVKAYNLRFSGHDHIFISCKRDGELDYIWLGQFTAKDWDDNMIYPQVKGATHLERRDFLAGKTFVTESVVSEYKNYWDGCTYKYAKFVHGS